MDDLDRALARLAGAPVPLALDDIESRVLACIDAQTAVARRDRIGAGVMAVVALGIGMTGAALPATANAGSPPAPLGATASLAPSTLLIGEP
jgi:hypothetical protein